MKSLWQNYKIKNNINILDKDIEVDVLIIGGGLTGLSTLFYLKDSNLKIALVERHSTGLAVTSRSTAKITFLQENIYSKLSTFHNEKLAKEYLDSQIWSINELTNIIKQNKIDCHLEPSPSYLYTNNKKDFKKIDKEKELLDKFNINNDIITSLPDKEPCKYGLKVNNTYTFNPIKYLNSLKNISSKKHPIYENTKIVNINKENDYYISTTNNNKIIRSKYVVIANHYPFFLFPYLTPLKVTLEKSYIKAYKTNNNYKYNAITIGKPTTSIRYYHDKNNIYKIILKNSHNIAIKQNEKENFSNFPKNETYTWSNIDIITKDYLPLIGPIDDNLLIGTGYNTWGMTNSCLAGKIISDIILNKDNKFIPLFNPKRNINLGKLINFPISISSNIYSYINSKVNINKPWYNKNIRFEMRNNKKIAIYTDDKNEEHIVYITCPHLKCNLTFNEVELTWDCPCHGSRFDIDGKCIQGPSNYDISYKKQ